MAKKAMRSSARLANAKAKEDAIARETNETPREDDEFVGKRVAKEFNRGIFYGRVVERWEDENKKKHWSIHYDIDGDREDIDFKALKRGLKLYEDLAEEAMELIVKEFKLLQAKEAKWHILSAERKSRKPQFHLLPKEHQDQLKRDQGIAFMEELNTFFDKVGTHIQSEDV